MDYSKSSHAYQEQLYKKGIIVNDPDMMYIYLKAWILSKASVPVVIQGESGTGKSCLAKFIRDAGSRAGKPLGRVNCNATQADLFASELFGYTPKAFTDASEKGKIGLLESANHGTVLFDEINELDEEGQVLLLHFLQNKAIAPIGSYKTKAIDDTKDLHLAAKQLGISYSSLCRKRKELGL